MLDMVEFAEAVVGVPGEGLNVEQRKLPTIGVELAAKPELLIFLDEPTSGLDSQSSWAIVGFLRKLANSGQAILATIHQPSSILFLEFDRLLFLAKGGKTVYFGDIGPNAETLLNYFETHGARPCGESDNPAEYILEIVTAGAVGKSGHDWPVIWKSSYEYQGVKAEQERIHRKMGSVAMGYMKDSGNGEFAMPLYTQILHTTIRVFQQYWRTPSYIWGKFLLGGVSALWAFPNPLLQYKAYAVQFHWVLLFRGGQLPTRHAKCLIQHFHAHLNSQLAGSTSQLPNREIMYF